MANFIFTVKEFFNKCLIENNVSSFYIAPYQRGYKWKSKTRYDQVPVLLTDLFEAYLKSNKKINKEYYLQYITVKATLENSEMVFEVIDGQQRLTSISLMYAVLETLGIDNITKKEGKSLLNYARHTGSTHIFTEIINDFNENKIKSEDYKMQDKFYMYEAVKCINSFFLLIKEDKGLFNGFIKFIENNVQIILNKEDEYTSAEEVFSSLNSNQVPLTNAYLIKGLLLTKASRGYTGNRKKHFKEIMDERVIMGRTWDEMNTWFSKKEISKYFFDTEENGLEQMLKLVKFNTIKKEIDIINTFRNSLENGNEYSTNYELFNIFHDNILSAEDSTKCLNEVKHIYKRFRSWYQDDFIYNMLGYYLIHNRKELKELLNLSNDKLKNKLKKFIHNKIPDKEIFKKYSYSKNSEKKKIEDLLLIISFYLPEKLVKSFKYRFNYYSYSIEKWSLEHIFPQSPKEDEEIDIKEDRSWMINRIKQEIEQQTDTKKINKNNKLIEKIEISDTIVMNEIELIFNDYTDEKLHNIGNMALLSGGINSALSNGLFNKKRKILLSRINSGSFVPKHTIEVFSKMLEIDENEKQFDTTLINWSLNDIDVHFSWLINKLEEIKTY